MGNNLADAVSPTEVYSNKDQLKQTTDNQNQLPDPWSHPGSGRTAVNILESPSAKTSPGESILTTR